MLLSIPAVYHVDDEKLPYRTKIEYTGDYATLSDFKNALNLSKTFKLVKEEISDDNAKLPTYNDRIEAWLVTIETSVHSDPSLKQSHSQNGSSHNSRNVDGRQPNFQNHHHLQQQPTGHRRYAPAPTDDNSGCDSESESRSTVHNLPVNTAIDWIEDQFDRNRFNHRNPRNWSTPMDASSAMTSELETTSFLDSEDEVTSRHALMYSTSTDITSISQQHMKNRRRRPMHRAISRASSVSSITESSMSLRVIEVILSLEKDRFLGLSVVGQTNQLAGDSGIYIGAVWEGGVVALDGRIDAGDMILQVNDTPLDNLTNDEAVHVLQEAAQNHGGDGLAIQAPNNNRLDYAPRSASGSSVSNRSGSNAGSVTEVEKPIHDVQLDIRIHDMQSIVRAAARPDSGLTIKTRSWLKISIPNAFLGSDLVKWLLKNVHGFTDEKSARKYASQLLKEGFIKHTVQKITFAPQCYYVFGDLCG
uniref:Dishevelled n=1 Tax=Romanomermis culicivorax TaxID=13658 RepID=A0A915JV86_ROMCU